MSVALAAGTIFAGYRIESLVARGGMGIVYRASDPSLHRSVALKLIAPELAEDDRFRRRFLRESRLAASLDHPSVVPVYEAGEHEGTLYLAMRFVDGRDLRTVLRRDGTLAPQRSLALLAQVAGALDAAHRRELVHRDVKPGNVLVDEEGHAYLTDFGVSKQLGGDSTDTGRLVGTLDYLAPEQIRGQRVDGRADQYALACVLYECLAGTPPFRRETEGETLWAHMQDEPPPLRDHAALEPILRKGLAKEPGDRYESCGALIDAALTARPRVLPALERRRHLILAAGVLALAAVIAVALTLGGGSPAGAVGNGVAAIAADGGRTFIPFAVGTGDIAVGEGGVWVVDSQDDTISKIDPGSARVVRTFKAPARLLDIAAGAGALWVANAEASGRRDTVSRIDPRTGAVTHTVKLPREPDRGGWPSAGHPELAVGAGGVWAGNREGTISRIDPRTGEVTATVDTFARRIAAGKEGVWVVGLDLTTITRIDPRTNRIGQSIHLNTNAATGLAVGAGSVWATSEEGRLIRIEPGPRPIQQTIEVGGDTEFVAFGAGAVWTADFVSGTVSRVDPHTNRVTATVTVGATQAIAAGAGSAWVSVAGGTRNGVLPASICGEVLSGGRKPDVLIASDLALHGADSRGMADTIRFVLQQHDFRAGRFTVGYRSCDDSTAQSGEWEPRTCAANANAFARADRLVAVIGTYHSDCSRVEIPILNRAPGGPLALVSAVNVFPNLTRGGRLKLSPPSGRRGEPDVYYPTGQRNFLRVIGRDDQEGVATALLAKELGLRRVYLLYDSFEDGNVSWTGPFRRTAQRLGIGIAGEEDTNDDASLQAAVVRRVARAGVDGVLLGDSPYLGGAHLLKRLRARLGPRVTIMGGSDYAQVPDLLDLAGRAAHGMYVATTELTADGPGMTAAAKRFAAEFGAESHSSNALQTAQATDVVLQAIARSDGTRASVLRELHATRVRNGLIGDFGFDRYGDVTPARVTILRVTGSTPAGVELPSYLHGSVVDRVLTVPASLAG